jgi:hypothetical protein
VQSQWDCLYGAALNSSSLIIDSGAFLLVETNSNLSVNNSVLYDIGGIILKDKSQINFASGTNQLSILPAASLSGDGNTSVVSTGGSLLFDNNGIVQGNPGLLSIALDYTFWTNSLGLGTYATTASNAVIEMFDSVTFQTNATNVVVGPGVTWFWASEPLSILGVLQVGAVDPTTQLPDPGTVLLDPNRVTGNGQIHVLGSPVQPSTLIWDDGVIDGPLIQIDANARLILSNTYSTTLSGSTISNAGTTLWLANAGGFGMDTGAVFNNLAGALFDDQNTNDSTIGGGGGGAPSVFNNAGTFRKSAGTNTSYFDPDDQSSPHGPLFVNTGLLDVQSGTFVLGPGTNSGQFNIPNGSQLTFASGTNVQLAGASFTGGGLVALSLLEPDLWLSADVTIQNLQVGGTYGFGTIDGPGNLTISGFLSAGGGIFRGGGAVNVNSNATFAVPFNTPTLGRSVNNSGSAVIATGILASQSIAWNNLPGSLLEMQTGSGNLGVNYSGAPPAFYNEGLFTNSSFGPQISWAFTNSGSVQIGSATSINFERGFTQTAGGTVIGAGATLTLGGAQVFLLLGGELSGVGTVSGSVINSAVIHPGDAPGALAIYGSFTGNSSGALAIEIAGPSSGGQYGQLNFPFNSQAAIGGALNLTFDNGFVPAVGERYPIVTGSSGAGGSFSGVFASLNGLRPTNGVVLVPVYTGSGVVLAVANDLIISSPSFAGNTLSFSFPTTTGLTNIVQYTDSLSPANWQTLSNVVGNGSAALIIDPSGAVPERFYRVSFK